MDERGGGRREGLETLARRLWPACVAVVGLVVIALTFRDYGITWDEAVQSHYGEGVLRYFASAGSDHSIDHFLHLRFYGPLFELLAALLYDGQPLAKYDVRHFMIATTGLGAVLGAIHLGSRLPGRWVLFFAPLLLVALPRFYGHAFNNSKDIPFACFFVWSISAMLRLAEEQRRSAPAKESNNESGGRRGLGAAALCGLAIGLTLAVRPGGLPILGLLYCAILSASLLQSHTRRSALLTLAWHSAVAGVIAWTVMVLPWPWAHENPIVNPLRAMLAALSFPDTFPVLFEGEITRSDVLPRYYLAKYLWITTPPVVLALASVGLVSAIRSQLRAPRAPASLALFAVEFWLFAPLLLATIGRPNVYDGMRHLLFTLPALALIAAQGASWLLEALSGLTTEHPRPAAAERWRWLAHPAVAAVAAAVLAIVCLAPIAQHVRLHPYQTTYFNQMVGGLAGAQGRYETDYWLASYKEAVEWVNARAAEQGRRLTVLVAADAYSLECARFFASPAIELVSTVESAIPGPLPDSFDYYIGTTRYQMHENFPQAPVAHQIGRMGGTLTLIRGRPEIELAGR